MKIFTLVFIQLFLSPVLATEPGKQLEESKNPILANTEGVVQVLVPALKIDKLKESEFKKINGKIFQVIPGVPGMAIPNGATIQTVGESKAQVILENGNSFVAGKATQMVMSWAQDLKGKTAFDVNIKDGLVRGIVKSKEDFNVSVLTKSFKAKIDNADFITGNFDAQNAKDKAKGAVLKMLHGNSKLMPLAKLSDLKKDMNAKEIVAKAGADIVMGLKDVKAIPLFDKDILKQATSINAKFDELKNAKGEDFVKKLFASADSLAQEVSNQPEAPADNCGCPTLEERIKRAALKKARAQLHEPAQKSEKADPENKTIADASTPADVKSTGPEGAKDNKEPKGILDEVDPLTELSCMSPVLTQLKGAAQIVNMLKDGIFSSKEAKPGDCVSNNSLFKNLTNSRSQLKFPNGDEIFSSDNTDVLMKWTKKKLDLKVDQGSIRGIFEKSTQRAVDLQSGGLKATTNGGDLNLSAPKPAIPALSAASAQLAVAGAAAPLAANLASGLLGSALSVFGGLASVAGQAIPAGSQIGAGQTKPQVMSPEQIAQLEAQTAVPPGASVASVVKDIPLTPPPSLSSAKPELGAEAASKLLDKSGEPVSQTQKDKSMELAAGAAASTLNSSKEAASVVGAIAAAAAGSAVSTATSAAAGVAAGASTSAAGNMAKINPLNQAANPVVDLTKQSGDGVGKALEKQQAPQGKATKSNIWDLTEEDPEETFIKKYLKWDNQ